MRGFGGFLAPLLRFCLLMNVYIYDIYININVEALSAGLTVVYIKALLLLCNASSFTFSSLYNGLTVQICR